MSHEHEQPGLDAVVRALAGVARAAPRIDRDRLMFLAGVASTTPGSAGASPSRLPTPDTRLPSSHAWLWPASTAALAATSLALALALVVRPSPPERIVYLPRPAIEATAPTQTPAAKPTPEQAPIAVAVVSRSAPPDASASNYVRSRDVALRFGLDALGSHVSASRGDLPAPTYRSLLESLAAPPPRSSGARVPGPTPGPMPESSQM